MLFQLFHIINLFTLLFSSTGVLVHQHYCLDELKSFSIYADFTEPCCKEQEKVNNLDCNNQKTQFNKKPCCEDKTLLCNNDNAQQNGPLADWVVAIPMPFLNKRAELPSWEIALYLPDFNKILRFYTSKAPPPKLSLHILFASFLC
jgi:hypothetical protein